ncbi:MAG: Mrp/NBP35 family ATP-binding protein [Candidatus Eisenbacteria bacterium]|nr:Mrp/NBP35 family ATP-binding protein [Candidatus Eisenbacteria bacterium]MCC7141593.1 Mrp/NBP35 family ATP-binding protein [Candidatus Eisenbacteria bacterium]
MPSPKEVSQILRAVMFPGIDRDIVSLGYVKDIQEENGRFRVRVEVMTSAGGVGDEIERRVRAALEQAGIAYDLDFRSNSAPQAAAASAPPSAPADMLAGIRWKIAVASGKGGVGKSTVAVNLAVALAQAGRKVGLLDSDVYGPSIPVMFGLEEERPQPTADRSKISPLERYGVRTMSIGYLVDRYTPVIWRGPMVGKAIDQLMGDVDWEGVEVMLFDLPPGTGDIQISLAQKIRLSGAIVVTTPQDVALIDAGKGVAMFEKVEVPIIGMVENMSHFSCPHCHKRTDIFRHGGAKKEANRLGVPFLGEIPLDPEVVLGGDQGTPIVVRDPDAPASRAFRELAQKVVAVLETAERR